MCNIIETIAQYACQINWEYVITILTILGSSSAIIVSIVMAKKQRTADIVTKNRMEWIQTLKKTMSDYYAKVKLFEDRQTPENVSDYLSELYVCESKIKLQLNCFGKYDKVIIKYISELNRSYDAFLHKVKLSKSIKDPFRLSKEMLEYISTYNQAIINDVLQKSINKYKLQELINNKKYDEFLQVMSKEELAVENVKNLLHMENKYIDDCCKIIRHLPDVILIYTEVYLKVEWERVKIESRKGNIKNFNFDNKFDNYLVNKKSELQQIIRELPERFKES